MNVEVLIQNGLSEVQARVYLCLVRNGQQTPSQIARDIDENRTTVYSALEKLVKLGVVSQKDKGKIAAFVPNHPSVLEGLAEKRLREVTRQVKNLESNLPSLINYYNECQSEPGAMTVYGKDGVKMIHEKIMATNEPYYCVCSCYDEMMDEETSERFKRARSKAGIECDSIDPSGLMRSDSGNVDEDSLTTRTVLPPDEYDSPVEIDIFGDNVAFINYAKDSMSTLIESPEIADAMRQLFLFAKKYVRRANDQDGLNGF